MAAGALLLALAQVVPALLRFVGKENEAQVAEKAVAIGEVLTGKQDAGEIVEALKVNPELAAKFQAMANELVLAELQEETKRLEAVNATMRAEYASGDPYVRRSRPTFLYVMAFTWGLQMLGLTVAVALYPERGAELIKAAGELTFMWSVALSMVGVYVKGRSDEKKAAAGQAAPSALESIASIVRRK